MTEGKKKEGDSKRRCPAIAGRRARKGWWGLFLAWFSIMLLIASMSAPAYATNGDNLIAIGPISRSMGGVGVAAPQDAISAVFSNPAAMCFGPYCPGSEFNFAGTLFMPKVKARVDAGDQSFAADSKNKVFAIPAIGLSVPVRNTLPLLRLGLAAYGVSGLGVDYRGSAISQPHFYDFGPVGQFPLIAGEFTQLQIMKFAPCIAFQPHERFSAGLALHMDYASLDLRSGTSFGYGFGVQLGALYKVRDDLSFGAAYISPQKVDHKDVKDLDGDGTPDSLRLEAPRQVVFGAAFEPIRDVVLIEADLRWVNWGDAAGYRDFDWRDQWVVAVGAQAKPTKKLALRAGYNYGTDPVKRHDNFIGMGKIAVQGKSMPVYYYEAFRIIGFPAIVKQHVTAGMGYEFSRRFAFNVGYTHAFRERIREKGTSIAGGPVALESELSENSIELGFTWRF